jgi:hypothetical protein
VSSLKTTQNLVTGVAGFLIPVLWFGMDWQGTQDKKLAARQNRQQYLATLAAQRRFNGDIPAYDDFLEERLHLMALKSKQWFGLL